MQFLSKTNHQALKSSLKFKGLHYSPHFSPQSSNSFSYLNKYLITRLQQPFSSQPTGQPNQSSHQININNISQNQPSSSTTSPSRNNSLPFLNPRDFCELTKIKLSFMNTFVALPTYFYLTAEISPTALTLAIATQLMAMSSQTFNQTLEAKYDKLMTRTHRRPVASGSISPISATIIGCCLYIPSNILFFTCFPISTGLIANVIFFSYIGIYTPLKRLSSFNTPVGAVVGALTPYIGYTAAGGSISDLYPLCFSIYMTFWQFQHFYGIAWIYRNDYIKAGFRMCDNKNEAVMYILGSFILNLAGNYVYFFMNPYSTVLSSVYALIMGVTYWKTLAKPTWAFYKDPNVNTAKTMKNMSYVHLMMFFGIILVDTFLHIYENRCKNGINEDGTCRNIDQEKLIGKAHMVFVKIEEEKDKKGQVERDDIRMIKDSNEIENKQQNKQSGIVIKKQQQ